MFTNKDVMELRKKTGVGIMDCKVALQKTKGNMDEAVKFLREKGMASAEKRASRVASQGIVDSYIHLNGSIGVLLEVNCETDFVARSAQFVEFVHDIALQIAAANPKYINEEDVPEDFIQSEREIALAQFKNQPNFDKKPEKVVENMINGKINKIMQEVCLMNQSFVKDADKTIKDLLNETTAAIGEKISIRRFTRYQMGEGLEQKKCENLAAEVEEQIAKAKK